MLPEATNCEMQMTKNIHTAKLPDGSVAKRTSTSGRAYLFCVAIRQSYDWALANAQNTQSYRDAGNYDHYVGIIARGGYRASRPDWQSAEDFAASQARDVAEARENIGAAKNEDEYLAAIAAKHVADVEARKAAGDFEKWGVHGWQSRRDLAEKELAKVLANKWMNVAEAKIIPVTMIAK